MQEYHSSKEESKKENGLFKKFLEKYNIDIKRVIRETEAES